MHLTYVGTSLSSQIRSYLLRSGSDFSPAGQHLSTLRARPVGGSMAEEGGARGRSNRPLRRRLRHGVSGAGGRRTIPGGVAGTTAEVRPGATSGQDPADRVRAKAGKRLEVETGEANPGRSIFW